MQNTFYYTENAAGIPFAYEDAIPVVPSDEFELPEIADHLWVRGFKSIRVTTKRGSIRDLSIGDSGTIIPITVKKVWATGTEPSSPGGGEIHGMIICK